MARLFWLFSLSIFIASCNCDCLKPPETAAAKPPALEGTKLCFIGDSGFDSDEQRFVAQALEREGCNYVIHLGDIVYTRGIKDEHDKKLRTHFWNHYRKISENSKIFLTLGNHDYDGNEEAWVTLAASEKNNLVFDPRHFYRQELDDGVCIVSLDLNKEFLDNSDRSAAQEEFIETQKAELKRNKCRFSIAFSHYPLFTSAATGTGGRRTAVSAVQKFLTSHVIGSFDVYVAGHAHHVGEEGTRKKTLLLVSGGAGSCRRVKDRDSKTVFARAGYIVLTVSSKSNGTAVGTYEIKTVHVGSSPGNGETGIATTRHFDTLVGKGIR